MRWVVDEDIGWGKGTRLELEAVWSELTIFKIGQLRAV